MKKILALISVIILFDCASAQSQLTHTWDEVDQAVTDVQNAQPIPDGKLVPDGGTTGQVLQKNSDTNGDTGWGDPPSGTGAQKWYQQLEVSDFTHPYILTRPFYDWKFSNIVGLTDVGTIDLDIQLCDTDNNCFSFLSNVVTIGNPETPITLSSDGITANHYVKIIPSNALNGVTRFGVYAAGTYETGIPPASGCDPATDYVGNKTEEASELSNTGGTVRLSLYDPATCNGVIETLYLYIRANTTTDSDVRILVYSDNGDELPGAGDMLITSARVTVSGTTPTWYYYTVNLGDVNDSTKYWMGFVNSDTAGVSSLFTETTDPGRVSMSESGVGDWADNPPSELPTGLNVDDTTRYYSVYGTIQ